MTTQSQISTTFPKSMYAGNKDLFKRSVAMRVLWLLLPFQVSKNLPKWLFKPIINYYIIIPPGDAFVPGAVLPPGFILPDYTIPEDHFIGGVVLPPGAIINYYFYPVQPSGDTTGKNKNTVWIDPSKPLTFNNAGQILPPGTQIRPLTDFQFQNIFSDPDQLGDTPIEASYGDVIDAMPPRLDIPNYVKPPSQPGAGTGSGIEQSPIENIKDDYYQDIIDKLLDDWFFDDYRTKQNPSTPHGTASAVATWTGSLECFSALGWSAARNAVNATNNADGVEPGVGGDISGGAPSSFYIRRGMFKFPIPALPSGSSYTSGSLVFYVNQVDDGSIAAQANTATNPALFTGYSKMTGNPTERFTNAGYDFLAVTLNADILDYLTTHSGEDVVIMTRNYDYDVLDVQPAFDVAHTLNVSGINAVDPSAIPTLLLAY